MNVHRADQSTVGAGNRLIGVFLEGLGHQYPNGANYPEAVANALWTVFETESLP